MQQPVQISSRYVSLSEAARENLRRRVAKLERFCDRILGCRIMVEAPHRHKHQGVLYHVRIEISLPGGRVVVRRAPHEDLYVAIREAFDAARRQILSFLRRQRPGHVSLPPPEPV